MANLFNIEGYCLGKRTICVETDKHEQPFIVNRERFEKWIDDRELRMDKMTDLILNWDYYYTSELAIKDLYDYIVIRQGSKNFDTDTLLVQMLKEN